MEPFAFENFVAEEDGRARPAEELSEEEKRRLAEAVRQRLSQLETTKKLPQEDFLQQFPL